jgi:hypothetical protein
VIFKLYRFDPVSLLVFHLPTCAIKGSRIHFVLFFRLRWIIASQQMKPRLKASSSVASSSAWRVYCIRTAALDSAERLSFTGCHLGSWDSEKARL